MAASEDLQFDMAAALVAVMVVLFELVHQDAKQPQDPSPGDFSVDILAIEEPVRESEKALFGPPQLTGLSGSIRTIAFPFPEYSADGTTGASASSSTSCYLTGDAGTGATVVYEGSKTNNAPLSDGTPLSIALEISRKGIKLSPNEGQFSGNDITEASFLSLLGGPSPLSPLAALPGISSDRANGGHLDVVRRGDDFPFSKGYKIDWASSPEFEKSWKSPAGLLENLAGSSSPIFADLGASIETRLIQVGSNNDWFSQTDDQWILASFLPYRPYSHITCVGNGEAIDFGTSVSLSVVPKCGTPCGTDIRAMHIVAIRLQSSTMPEPIFWLATSGEAPPFRLSSSTPPATLDTSEQIPKLVEAATLLFEFE